MAISSTTVHYEKMPLMCASPLGAIRIRELGTYWDDVEIFVRQEYAERLPRAVAAFNAIMQEQDGPPASAPDRSPEERAAAEAGYMPVSEYVERNT